MELTIHEAFAKAQCEFPLIKKTEINPFFKSKYADLSNILEVVMPILHKNGLYLTQSPVSSEQGIGVSTSIVHIATGEMIRGSFSLPLAKQDPQGAGSAITYAKRYAIVAMLGLNVDVDDDGNTASTAKKVPTIKKEPTIQVDDLPFLN